MPKRVLVVDDDGLIRRLARSSLETRGFEVHEAADPHEARDKLTRVDPDLVLMDVWMQRVHALDVTRPEPGPRRRVILLTGLGPEAEPTPELLSLADDHVEKPFLPVELASRVERQFSRDMGSSGPSPGDPDQLLGYARQLEQAYRENSRKTRQLREANRRLKELERMKDVFLSLVSHELRTPLTIIKGYLHLLKRLLPDGLEPSACECLEGVGEASNRLERLIEELLSFSGMRKGLDPASYTTVSLKELIDSVVREHEPLARTRMVHLEWPGCALNVEGDATRLREALGHVVKNAILFNRQGGGVFISAYQDDGQVIVTVSDEGLGIAATDLQRVFSPFYQSGDVSTRSVEGLGLGLSITRHILEGHGGSIELASEPTKGTTVALRLPVSPEPAVGPREEVPSEPQAAAGDLLDYAREVYRSYDAERIRRQYLEQERQELESTFIQTVSALMRLIDPRGTRPSIDRVAAYARALASRLDPTLPDTKDFMYSLLLYDVGKIGIAESVLHKAGELTDEERLAVQAHAEIGADILGSIRSLRPALEGVRSHHERWDGSGYPDGLRGHEIPLLARIIAVADSFDAMTVDRPYRRALTLEQAKEQIVAGAGRHFDPDVVRAFEEGWAEISELAAQNAQAGSGAQSGPRADSDRPVSG